MKLVSLFAASLAISILLSSGVASAGTPIVTTGDVTDVTPTSATLHGTVDPNGGDVSYDFAYVDGNGRLDPGWGHSTAGAGTLGAGAGPTDVAVTITGLGVATPYFFRLETGGGFYGQTKVFGTKPTAPSAGAWQSGVESATSALLKGAVSTGGITTFVHFEYGPTTSYGLSTPTVERHPDTGPNCSIDPLPPPPSEPPPPWNNPFECWVGAAAGSLAATEVDSLEPGTVYHDRLVAQNGLGTSVSGDSTFTTSSEPSPPEPPEPALPPPLRSPGLAGHAVVGGTLTCESSLSVIGYAWLRDDSPIRHATGRRYTLQPADAGHFVTCSISAYNVDDSLDSALSRTVLVPLPPPSPAILTHVAPVTAGGMATLRLACRERRHRCTGVLTLTLAERGHRAIAIARARVSLPARASSLLRLRLDAAGRSLLARARHRSLTVEAGIGLTRRTLVLSG